MTDASQPAAADPASRLPLFYRDPRPLSSIEHADWRLKDGGAAFAAETPFVPIVVGEIASAARCYPVVFAAGDVQPVALLGLERANLFVADDGEWSAGAYVPAYVRRYPFGFMATREPDGFALAIDAGSDRIATEGGEGTALFEDGQPSELTRQAMTFCEAFHAEALNTTAFGQALVEQELLIDRRADATLPDGRKLGLDGFRIIDAERFAALPDAVVTDWHRKGWLALVHFHLTSLERFADLLDRQSQRAAPTEAVKPAARAAKSAKASAQ